MTTPDFELQIDTPLEGLERGRYMLFEDPESNAIYEGDEVYWYMSWEGERSGPFLRLKRLSEKTRGLDFVKFLPPDLYVESFQPDGLYLFNVENAETQYYSLGKSEDCGFPTRGNYIGPSYFIFYCRVDDEFNDWYIISEDEFSVEAKVRISSSIRFYKWSDEGVALFRARERSSSNSSQFCRVEAPDWRIVCFRSPFYLLGESPDGEWALVKPSDEYYRNKSFREGANPLRSLALVPMTCVLGSSEDCEPADIYMPTIWSLDYPSSYQTASWTPASDKLVAIGMDCHSGQDTWAWYYDWGSWEAKPLIKLNQCGGPVSHDGQWLWSEEGNSFILDVDEGSPLEVSLDGSYRRLPSGSLRILSSFDVPYPGLGSFGVEISPAATAETIRIPTEGPLSLRKTVVLLQSVSNTAPWLAAAEPGRGDLTLIAPGCVVSMSEESGGRVAVVLGESVSHGCGSESIYRLRLSIVSMPDLEIKEITSLTSHYSLAPGDRNLIEPEPADQAIDAIIRSQPEWSPDGRYLAFVAAIDGASSDLYVYDSENNRKTRLSSGTNQAIMGSWSPDNGGILHYEYVYDRFDALREALWYAPLDGGDLVRMQDAPHIGGWLSNFRFFGYRTYKMDNAVPMYIGDITSGEVRPITDDGFMWDLIWDGESGHILFHYGGSLVEGLFFLDGPEGFINETPLTKETYAFIKGLSDLETFLVNSNEGLVLISLEGEVTVLDSDFRANSIQISPDERWIAAEIDRDYYELYRFGMDGELEMAKVLGEGNHARFEWHPEGWAVLLDCRADYALVAEAPNWNVERVEGGCPIWHGWSGVPWDLSVDRDVALIPVD